VATEKRQFPRVFERSQLIELSIFLRVRIGLWRMEDQTIFWRCFMNHANGATESAALRRSRKTTQMILLRNARDQAFRDTHLMRAVGPDDRLEAASAFSRFEPFSLRLEASGQGRPTHSSQHSSSRRVAIR